MIKVYYETIPDLWIVPIVFSHHKDSIAAYETLPYRKKAFEQISGDYVERVTNPSEADYLLVPHHYGRARRVSGYLDRINQLAREHNKKILVFAFQDDATPINWPEAIIFRVSAYASEMLSNEFIVPYIVEDFTESYNFLPKKLANKVSVGFVGLAGFDSNKQMIRSSVKEVLRTAHSLLTRFQFLKERRKGIFVRSEMLKVIQKEKNLDANFLIRGRYSGHADNLSPEQVKKIRDEYISNIVESDLTLSPRGEGNGSQRFYEVLSLGRIPLLIDTDNQLPFEEVIPYERFVIRIPYSERKNVGKWVSDFFADLTQEEYEKRQEEARFYFKKYLSLNGYYSYLFVDEYVRELDKQSLSHTE
tara:strand:- start:2545 stop:3627 length:1083 start_codon:yes stop_codon:yes gene_type:complete